MEYVRVKLDRIVAALTSGLTYHVPLTMQEQLTVGSLVSVPLQNSFCRGIVVAEESAEPEFATKDIHRLLDQDGPSLNVEQIKLIDWLATRYLCPWSAAFQTVLPASVKAKIQQRYEFQAELAEELNVDELDASLQEAFVWFENSPQPMLEERILEIFGKKLLKRLIDLGVLQPEERIQFPPLKEYRKLLPTPREDSPGRGKIQDFWKRLKENVEPISEQEIKSWPEYRSPYLKKLLDLEFLLFVEQHAEFELLNQRQLTTEQEQALAVIETSLRKRSSKPLLLHGITSSGKTEVYFRAIASALQQKRSALMLVPEISLTAQMIERFRERFGEKVMLWHSGLSHGERSQIWQRLKNGETAILLGARSAIFAPFARLGVIILDEEHETTYQQEEDPKYHAREVALIRARHHKATVVLGSATPSIQSYYLAEQKQYHLMKMTQRIGIAVLPEIIPVDMRNELRLGNRSIFSDALKERIKLSLSRDEQVILFHNRRGFHRMSLCRSCGFVMECPDCEVPLILHREGRVPELRCHYCGHLENMPPVCPQCGSIYFRFFGMGTEKVVEECRRTFPNIPVLRMDRDSTRGKGQHAEIIKEFEKPKAAILVGTQMIAKGFDFPLVTCVGILSADALLRSEDALAAERSYALLMQVSGRAGRGEVPGQVLIQSYDPEHPILQAVYDQDYEAFYQREIEYRKRHRLPPFGHLATITASDEDPVAAESYLASIKSVFPESFEVFGPDKARVFCLQKKYRYRLIVNAPNRPILIEILKKIQDGPIPSKGLQRSMVIDPMWLS
jgi:primosomal protein N' (replication factor Y)